MYMLKIAIVDDEIECINNLVSIIEKHLNNKQIEYNLYQYQSGEEFLGNDIAMDLLFLDIQMNGIDGIKTGQLFRSQNVSTTLIYITSYPDYIMQSMLVHPFAFVVKPYQEEDITKNLDDYFNYYYSKLSEPLEETHGHYVCELNNYFSTGYETDISLTQFNSTGHSVIAYVGVPNGNVLKYDPNFDEIPEGDRYYQQRNTGRIIYNLAPFDPGDPEWSVS